MTTEPKDAVGEGGSGAERTPGGDLEALNANLAKVEALSQRLVAALGRRRPAKALAPGTEPRPLHAGRDRVHDGGHDEPLQGLRAPGRPLGAHHAPLPRGAGGPGQGHAASARRPNGVRQAILRPTVADASLLQLRQAAVSADRRGHDGGHRGPRRARRGGPEALGLLRAPDHGLDEPRELPRHQPRRAFARGGHRRAKPGGRAGEPRARPRGGGG